MGEGDLEWVGDFFVNPCLDQIFWLGVVNKDGFGIML